MDTYYYDDNEYCDVCHGPCCHGTIDTTDITTSNTTYTYTGEIEETNGQD